MDVTDKNIAIELKGLSKTFGSIIANDHVDLYVKKGEILALLGENGSGKTTLMNMLSGIYKPDSGAIYVEGEPVSIQSPEDAKRLHIGMVHQHFKLVEKFSAADNIWIAADDEKKLFLTKERNRKIRESSERFGFDIDPEKRVCDMAVSEKQTVEILKVLYNGARVLILDEPTAVLTLQETRKLFAILRRMRDAGCAIIIITHKLNEVLEVSDRVTILRKGKSIASVETAKTNAQELSNLMVGRAVSLSLERPECAQEQVLLRVEGLSARDEEGARVLDNISFSVHGGEILGVAGVAGCGQKELCEAIAGLKAIESGQIFYKDENITGRSPRQIIDLGISMSFIPEDRLGMGLAASLDISDNMMLKNYVDKKGPFVDRRQARKTARDVVEKLEVVTPGIETPVRRLSGGNVQKVLLGREMQGHPNVVITAYPVRGLDINSSHIIYHILNDEKARGAGVLFVGEDLDVMLEFCDRIMVLCHGRVVDIVDAKSATKEQLGLLMTDAGNSYSLREEGSAEDAFSTLTQSEFAQESKKRKQTKGPLFHVVKRIELPISKSIWLYLASVLAALLLGGIFIACNGINPFTYYGTVLTGCFSNAIYLRGFVRIIIPLIITSLGVAVAFKMKFWNIGANGQFIIGAIFAATVALALGNSAPRWLTLLLMAVAGTVAGGLFGLLPAWLKVRFGTSETLLTLMLNYVAFYLLTYLKNLLFFRKVSETGAVFRPDFKILPENAWIYDFHIFGISVDISLIIALILVALVAIYLRYSKHGFEISVVGDSLNTARYAGMNVNKVMLRTMFASAALVGLAGMLQVSGSATGHTLSDNITSDVGWTGIIVAWLAKLNPIAILIVSVLMGILQKGTSVAESIHGISSAASDILEGIILFTVLAADFFVRYKLAFRSKEGGDAK